MKRCTWVRALLCALLVPVFAWAQGWVWQHPKPQGNTIHDICQIWTPYGGTGWAVGDKGTLLSTNNCNGYGQRPSLGSADLYAVAMTDIYHAWIVGNRPGVIYRTTDQGQSWVEQFRDTSWTLYDVTFIDTLCGWVVGGGPWYGDPGVVMRTTDGGLTWTSDTTATNYGQASVSFVDRRHGWITGYNYMARTTDGGVTWQQVAAPDWSIQDVVFTDTLTGFIAGLSQVFVTHDAGLSWQACTERLSTYLMHIEFVDRNRGWVTGGSGLIYHTTNGGSTWRAQTTGTRETINSLHFFDYPFGQAVGSEGLLIWTNDGGDHWYSCSSNLAEGAWLTRASCAPRNIPWPSIWAIGHSDSTIILHTPDGGVHWTRQQTPWTYPFQDVAAVSRDSAFLVGGGGGILITTDGGGTWLPQYSRVTWNFDRVSFINSRVGWAAGGSGQLLHTTDAGINWTVLSDQYETWLNDMVFVDANHGWIADGGKPDMCHLRRTTDGGCTWETVFAAYDTCFLSVHFLDAQNGWVGGMWCDYTEGPEHSLLWHTTDGGHTWEHQTVGVTREVRDVLFADFGYGWALADEQLYVTNNGGTNWFPQDIPTAQHMSALCNFDHHNCWVVGESSSILFWNGTNPIQPAQTLQPKQFALAAFPNPFNPRTTIRFDLPATSLTELSVFDVTGRLVAHVFNGRLDAGSHEMAFDASALPSSIYFAHLVSGNLQTTQKLVLLK
jgi:photosystem II stability/assembly factor-like uncharacterized protein